MYLYLTDRIRSFNGLVALFVCFLIVGSIVLPCSCLSRSYSFGLQYQVLTLVLSSLFEDAVLANNRRAYQTWIVVSLSDRGFVQTGVCTNPARAFVHRPHDEGETQLTPL